jgi:diguanylate cyclase (GGDEF)-like protein
VSESVLTPPPKHRLLIVDDQPANIRVMAEALRDHYELFFATSGSKALEIASTAGVELVLLDVVMPDLDGFEVCRRLRSNERTSRIPVIFVTAREETSDEARGFDVGAVDYITKPIRPPVVRARVRTQLELKQARDLLETLASVDALTGIGNRRRFDHSLDEEWRRAVRNGSWFSLAILDVDHFKRFNDTYGHARGDECLRAIAQAITVVARRPGDLAARYGGEEFGIILPETDPPAMAAVMKRLLAAVEALAIPHAASLTGAHVSVSVGAVSVVASTDREAASILEAADRLLYEAKENGRNRVVHLDGSGDATDAVTLQLESSS